jgi:hypothetical protein
MAFYYGSSEPPEDQPPGSWRETISIIFAVFRTLALPLGLLFAAIFGLMLLIWSFTVSPLIGLALLGLLVAALVGYGVWEAKHPPELP